MHSFQYHTPNSIEEASQLLIQAGNAQLLAGGQSLLPMLKARPLKPTDLIKINPLLSKRVELTENRLMVGAGITHAELNQSNIVSQHLSALSQLAGEVGDAAVRHRGTLGGALAVSDPSGDYPAACLALDAIIHTNQRQIESGEFFTGAFENSLLAGEIILSVTFAIPHKAHYVKILDIAARTPLVGVFVALHDEPKVAVIGVREQGVYRERVIEKALKVSFYSDAVSTTTTVTEDVLSSLHGSADYRSSLVSILARRAVDAANKTSR